MSKKLLLKTESTGQTTQHTEATAEVVIAQASTEKNAKDGQSRRQVIRQCECCDKPFSFADYRKDTARYCSRSCASQSRVTSEETREKLRRIMILRGTSGAKGKTWQHSNEYKAKKRAESLARHAANPDLFIGEGNPNWKGGIVPPKKRRVLTREWKALRLQVIGRDGGRCKECGQTSDIQIHHIRAWADGGTDEASNLITLCCRCHAIANGKQLKARNVKS